jgi:hypothetical protein
LEGLVYWADRYSVAPFPYLPWVNLFPPQINDGHSFLSTRNTAKLFKFGFWSEGMDIIWRATADFLIVGDQR